MDRRQILSTAGAALAAGAVGPPARAAEPPRFRLSFNTSTIRGQKVPLPETVDLVARAGYDAIEPWMNEIDAYVQGGGSLAELRKRIQDRGLAVESAIGFFEWIVDDDARRARALDEAARAMDRVAQLGGKRIAAPPVGATDQSGLDLLKAAARYRDLCEVGRRQGVVPQVEVWGFSRTLQRLGEAGLVAVESGHPDACVLADVYHLYKGGSDFEGLKLLSAAALQVFHVNDYPAGVPRGQITDAHRVYPGDGVAPWKEILGALRSLGFRGVLSLELFNREYWMQDPALVVRTGLEKLKAVVARST